MKHILVLLLLCSCLTAKPQRIIWWNVENLFDCQHDSLKEDYDFLPEGQYHWTKGRYWKKLDNIAEASQGSNIVINVNGANKDPREIAEEVRRILIRETNQRRLAWQ